MKRQTRILTLVACALALTSTAALAQGHGQAGGQRQQADRMMDRDLQQNQDRMQKSDRDKAQQQAQEKQAAMDRQQAQQKDQAKEQKQLKDQVQAQDRDQRIYGHDLMSVEERNQYHEQLREIDSDDERGKFIAEHREEMQLRAKAQGVVVDDDETEEAE